ncbi:MAG: hypothetical protein U0J62_09825 [Lachnospiraceae bacterium]|nr:hypothetical protein [Lachnospiraceae bacterium]
MATNLSLFLKGNKKQRENRKYAATKSLCDADGKPLEWEIKPLTTKENDKIREECTLDIPIKGKPGMYRQKQDTSLYLKKMICASVVFPDLFNAQLQDSYGVTKPEDLIVEMIDDPGEYNDLAVFIQDLNGFSESINEKVDMAKN